MKIYTKDKPVLIKVDFYNNKERITLTVCNTDFEEASEFMQAQALSYGSAIKKGRSTTIRVREYIDGKITRGKDKSFSFYGLTPEEIHDIVVDVIQSENY